MTWPDSLTIPGICLLTGFALALVPVLIGFKLGRKTK